VGARGGPAIGGVAAAALGVAASASFRKHPQRRNHVPYAWLLKEMKVLLNSVAHSGPVIRRYLVNSATLSLRPLVAALSSWRYSAAYHRVLSISAWPIH